jgi:hypothetical protein
MQFVFWNNYEVPDQEFVLVNIAIKREDNIICLSIGLLGIGIAIATKV